MAHETVLRRDDAILILVDVQEKLLPAMDGAEAVTAKCRLLLEGCAALDVPVIITEQYPKGLGATVAALRAVAPQAPMFEKMSFSCTGSDELIDFLDDLDRDQILLCGIETHVCVLQTALELMEQGAQVQVAADAVASRDLRNRDIALARMDRAGAVITCAESALFEMLQVAGTDEFKTIAKLLR